MAGGEIGVAVFRERTAAQTDDLDRAGRGVEEQEAHHRLRILEQQSVRLCDAHGALDVAPVCKKAADVAEVEDERAGLLGTGITRLRRAGVEPSVQTHLAVDGENRTAE